MSQQQTPMSRDGATQPTPVVHAPEPVQQSPTMPVVPPQQSPYGNTQYYQQPAFVQQQFYQQPPKQPPPRKPEHLVHRTDTKSFLIVLGIIVLFISVCGYALIWSGNASSQATANATATASSAQSAQDAQDLATANAFSTQYAQYAQTPIPTDAPTIVPTTPPNPHGDVGVSQQSGNWNVTVDSITTSQGEDYNQPKAGDVFVIVTVTAQNQDSATQSISEIDFTLRGSDGTTFSYAFLTSVPPISGDVLSNQRIKGGVAFEVPTSMHDFAFQFNPSFDPSGAVQWSLSV